METKIVLAQQPGNEREGYSDLLVKAGYWVDCISTDAAAIEIANRPYSYRLMIIDRDFPSEGRGADMMNEVLDENPDMPVVYHTDRENDRDNFRTWIAGRFIVKGRGELIHAIEELLAERTRIKS